MTAFDATFWAKPSQAIPAAVQGGSPGGDEAPASPQASPPASSPAPTVFPIIIKSSPEFDEIFGLKMRGVFFNEDVIIQGHTEVNDYFKACVQTSSFRAKPQNKAHRIMLTCRDSHGLVFDVELVVAQHVRSSRHPERIFCGLRSVGERRPAQDTGSAEACGP